MNNMVSLVTSTYLLDLGFYKSAFLFFGGGLTGAAAHIVEQTWLKDLRSFSRLWSILDGIGSSLSYISAIWPLETPGTFRGAISTLQSKIPMYITVCGASAAAFSFMGAETVHLVYALRQSFRALKRYRKHSAEWTSQINHVSNLAFLVFGRSVSFLVQISLMSKNDFDPIAYSAHVGGFIFGAMTMLIWKAEE